MDTSMDETINRANLVEQVKDAQAAVARAYSALRQTSGSVAAAMVLDATNYLDVSPAIVTTNFVLDTARLDTFFKVADETEQRLKDALPKDTMAKSLGGKLRAALKFLVDMQHTNVVINDVQHQALTFMIGRGSTVLVVATEGMNKISITVHANNNGDLATCLAALAAAFEIVAPNYLQQ